MSVFDFGGQQNSVLKLPPQFMRLLQGGQQNQSVLGAGNAAQSQMDQTMADLDAQDQELKKATSSDGGGLVQIIKMLVGAGG